MVEENKEEENTEVKEDEKKEVEEKKEESEEENSDSVADVIEKTDKAIEETILKLPA